MIAMSRRLVVVPFDLVQPLLEPRIVQQSKLLPSEVLKQPLVPATKIALYASALNRQLGLKHPEGAGDPGQSIADQNSTVVYGDSSFLSPESQEPRREVMTHDVVAKETESGQESRLESQAESVPETSRQSQLTSSPLIETPTGTLPKLRPRRGVTTPRIAAQQRLRTKLGTLITKDNQILGQDGSLLEGSDATKLIDYATNPDYYLRAPRQHRTFLSLLKQINVDDTLIKNLKAKKIFAGEKKVRAKRLKWDNLEYD